jgi:hypothetical protein
VVCLSQATADRLNADGALIAGDKADVTVAAGNNIILINGVDTHSVSHAIFIRAG